jgi:hypothetical protein
MMDIEKINARARAVLMAISGIGVLVFASGIALTLAVILKQAQQPSVASSSWIDGLVQASGPIVLAAVGLLIACMPWGIMQVVAILVRRAGDERYRTDQMMNVFEQQRQILENIRETAALSDAAKQVAYRAKDLDALRAAIREDIEKGDFEAATMLVNEMERRFGYAQEADKLREQITDHSKAAVDQRVAVTVETVDLLLQRFEWDEAVREAERLLRMFPNHPVAKKLPVRIETARDDHKRELLKLWKDAIAKDDVDRSVELLRQLDQYLSASEAEAYKESARDVFRKRLQQLGVQFALHVHDKSWTEALRIGRQITDEFPNTRMAAEVRERLPILQEKAGQPLGV